MTELYLFPRLPRPAARACLSAHRRRDLHELRAASQTTHPAAAPAPTGGTPVPETALCTLQDAMRREFDGRWPEPPKPGEVAGIDRSIARVLEAHFPIVPPDAGNEGVWAFLTLVLLPDIAAWRFIERAEDRLLGTPRNAFRRPWERRRVLRELHERPGVNGRPLGEDELVNIFERSRMARSHDLARVLASHILKVDLGPRSEYVRELCKHLKRRLAYINVDILGTADLEGLVDEAARAVRLPES